ncbi:hypothetical protein E1265_25905 [Streptomyces sp. 8K308]|uniref:hypothetical protein n=1 Tax=Streptomyces sp. 8K308 TaxID=2530388 RepID=UPI001046B9D0|nr:hypothetical protein [Streptomyces sp. 8K308]TDC16016.1 hypothetical protein E1265_25905 [Streptomyces sp. 8K308]
MKSTLTMRSIANPRRTTLAHLSDAGELAPAERPAARVPELPQATANPRRTVLKEREDAA